MSTIADIVASISGIARKPEQWNIGLVAGPNGGGVKDRYTWDAEYHTLGEIIKSVMVSEGMGDAGEMEDATFVQITKNS